MKLVYNIKLQLHAFQSTFSIFIIWFRFLSVMSFGSQLFFLKIFAFTFMSTFFILFIKFRFSSVMSFCSQMLFLKLLTLSSFLNILPPSFSFDSGYRMWCHFAVNCYSWNSLLCLALVILFKVLSLYFSFDSGFSLLGLFWQPTVFLETPYFV